MLRRAALLSSGLSSAGVKNGIIQDSWDTIIEICQSGRASEFYSVGDKKVVNATDPLGAITFRLAGFRKDFKADDTGMAETSWIIEAPLNYSSDLRDSTFRATLTSYEQLCDSLCRALELDNRMKALFPASIVNSIVKIKKSYRWSYWRYPSAEDHCGNLELKFWIADGPEICSTSYGSCLYVGFLDSIGGSFEGWAYSRTTLTGSNNSQVTASYAYNGRAGTGGSAVFLGFCL